MKVTITPKFSVKEIMDTTIRKDWFIFQSEAFDLGVRLTAYMQNYINSRRKRKGGSGNLAKTITFEPSPNTTAQIGWGIGNIALLNAKAKYWYVINYGKTVSGQPFVPGKGKFVPGSFEGSAPRSALRGGAQKFNYKDGSGMGMNPKSAVRPINYIQASRAKMNRNLLAIILKIKKGL